MFNKDYLVDRSQFDKYEDAEMLAKKCAANSGDNVFIYKKIAVAKALIPPIEVMQLTI